MNHYLRNRSRRHRHRNLHRTRHLEPLEPRLLLAVINWSGEIPDGTVFRSGDIQHILGEATVATNSTLTLEPAAMVQFGRGLGLTVDGTLDARGTAEQPILITSDRDDTGFDGILDTGDDVDTTGDGPGGPFQGAWRNIEFTSSSRANVLDHVEVRAGGSDFLGQLVVNGAELTLTHSALRVGIAGLRIGNSAPNILDTSFQDHRFAAISMDLASSPEISAVALDNNGTNGLVVDGGVLPGDAAWDNPDIVYGRETGSIPFVKGVCASWGHYFDFPHS